jgi:hypothetical protein
MIRSAKLRRFVYFMRRVDGTGPIKIGNTSAPQQRLREINLTCESELQILALAPGGFTAERAVHLKFASERIRGEWFSPSAELAEFIDKVEATGELPLLPEERREMVFAERYLAGDTYQRIANDHGLSRERVRQILRSHGVPSFGRRKKAA